MRINIKHIHNRQAVEVRGATSFEAWRIFSVNESRFNYLNDSLNGLKLATSSVEAEEGFRGNY